MRVLRIQDTCSKIAISRTSLWRLCKQDDFPQPISIGGGRVIGFLCSGQLIPDTTLRFFSY
ncbi:AlpA family phage regulatory protein [Pseudomonas viridiflava]|uniref:helix-turn-helix transcriptional regulator n=1 Tax=Pseudomonas viridiflava TaxID=33069 RepID=UPI000F055E18